MIKAVIWDFDGVVVETELLFVKKEIEIFKDYNISLDPDEAAKYFGLKLEEYVKALAGGQEPQVIKKIAQRIQSVVDEVYRNGAPFVANAPEVIRELSQKYPMAIATSRERALVEQTLSRKGLQESFAVIVSKDDVKKGKPDPEVFEKAAKGLEVPPPNCIVIEDAINGVIAAKKAGMKVIARKGQHNKNIDFSLADFVVVDMREIAGIIKQLSLL